LNEQRWVNEEQILGGSQLKKKIQQLGRELDAIDTSSVKYSETEDELFARRRELEQLQDNIRSTNPLYYQSFVDRTFVTIDDAKRMLTTHHQALVELFAGDSAVY